MGWTIIWPMIVGALIHEAGTVIQAPKPVCQFMAEDIPPPVLNQLVIRYLVNLLVSNKEPSSPTGWQQSPQPQAEDTKKSQKLDCVPTGFIYDDAVNFTVDVRLWHLFHNVPPIVSSWNFQESLPLAEVMPTEKIKVRGQRSRSQRSKQILPQFWCFRTITPVWIDLWLRNDAQSLK